MQISPKKFRQLASDVDDMHHEGMKSFREETAELHLSVAGNSRRSFVRKAGIGGAAVAFGSSIIPVTNLLPRAAAQGLSDTDIAVFAESVELAAVAAYNAAAGVLSDEVKPVGQLFASHHQDHADAFAALAGDAATGEPNAALVQALTPTLEGLSDQAGALEFAFQVENEAVATYAFALGALQSVEAAQGTATILPIEAAHAASLAQALGKSLEDHFPFGAFESADIADGINPADFPVS